MGKAQIKIKPIVVCKICRKEGLSSQALDFEFDFYSTHGIDGIINQFISSRFVEPPIGWSVTDRQYTCGKCK
jgi:hypothetical protein